MKVSHANHAVQSNYKSYIGHSVLEYHAGNAGNADHAGHTAHAWNGMRSCFIMRIYFVISLLFSI